MVSLLAFEIRDNAGFTEKYIPNDYSFIHSKVFRRFGLKALSPQDSNYEKQIINVVQCTLIILRISEVCCNVNDLGDQLPISLLLTVINYILRENLAVQFFVADILHSQLKCATLFLEQGMLCNPVNLFCGI